MIQVYESREALELAGKALTEYLHSHQDFPILFLCSGGSALKILDFIDTEPIKSNTTISVLDERLSSDELTNNFSQLSKTIFFKEAVANGAGFISTIPNKDQSLDSLGNSFETELKNWRNKNPEGKIVATVGIGADGHTAGIFTSIQENGALSSAWVIAYNLPVDTNPHRERVTVTYSFLREQVDLAVGYLDSDSKAEIIGWLKDKKIPNDKPMKVYESMSDVRFFVD